MLGIYCYIDTETKKIVYIGKDSHINKKVRYYGHRNPSAYNHQQFNRVLQNNMQRYHYKELDVGVENQKKLNELEIMYISVLKPKFNYTNGGEGITGYKHTDEAKKNISKNNARYWLGKKFSREHITNNIKSRPPHHETQHNQNISKATNSTGIYRVHKDIDKTCKQGYLWKYEFYDENLNHKKIRRVNLWELKDEVKRRGLPWIVLDKSKLNQLIENYKIDMTVQTTLI